MNDDGGSQAVLYQVVRVLEFVGGGAVSLPIRQFADQNEAAEQTKVIHEAFAKRTSDPAFVVVFGEIGVVQFAHRVMRIQAPDSRIVIPTPRLVIPG